MLVMPDGFSVGKNYNVHYTLAYVVPPSESLASSSSGDLEGLCFDCSGDVDPIHGFGIAWFEKSGSVLIAAIHGIEEDASFTGEMKSKKRQKLMNGKADDGFDEDEKKS